MHPQGWCCPTHSTVDKDSALYCHSKWWVTQIRSKRHYILNEIQALRCCKICNEDVGGGQPNWEQHINGKVHLKKLEKVNLPPPNCKQQITSFFTPKLTQQSVVLNMQPPINATSLSRKLLDTIIIDNVIEDVEGTSIKAPLCPLLRQLQAMASTPSNSIPLGVKTDLPNLFHLFSNSLLIQLKYSLYHMVGIRSYFGRGGDLISLNEEIQPSVVYFWCEDPL